MLLQIAMHPADVNTCSQQCFVDLFILRKTRCRNQSVVRLFVLTLPLSRQGATCCVYRYSAKDRPILKNDCDLGIRFKKRSKAGRKFSAERAVKVKILDHDDIGTGCPEY